MDSLDTFWMGWTTVSKPEDARTLAKVVIEKGLAFCAQIDAPIQSIYIWEGKLEESTEYRITMKFMEEQRATLTNYLLSHHPYDTPQWNCLPLQEVAEKYAAWAKQTTLVVEK